MAFAFLQRLFNRESPEDRQLRELIAYDPQRQYPVIRSSVCTGEKVAGFRDRQTGRFKEVMLLRDAADEERFRRIFHLEEITTEY